MSKLKNTLWTLTTLLFVAPAAALVFFSLPFTGWKALSVQTGSMVPKLPIGSVVLVHKVPVSTLSVGQVITYKSLDKPITITHRIVQIHTVPGGFRQFITKGDANLGPDALPVGSRQVIGVVNYAIPGIGRAIDFVRTVPGLLLLVYLPAVLLAGYEIYVLVSTLSKLQLEEYKTQLGAKQRALLDKLRQQRGALRTQAAVVKAEVAATDSNRPRPIQIILLVAIVSVLCAAGGLTYALSSRSAVLSDISISAQATAAPGNGCRSVVIESLRFTNNDDEDRPIIRICAPSCVLSTVNSWILKGDEDQQLWHSTQMDITCTTHGSNNERHQPAYWDQFTLSDSSGHTLDTFRVRDGDDRPNWHNHNND